jgi:hypothetical protein
MHGMSRQIVSHETLVPPAQLAHLLVKARSESGKSLEEVHESLEGKFTVRDLRQVEAATVALNDDDLRTIAKAYEINLGVVTPARTRLVLDQHEGVLAVGSKNIAVRGQGDEDILLRYLALVYQLRGEKPGEVIVPREEDLEVLCQVFGGEPDQIRDHLVSMMSSCASEIKKISASMKKRVAIPGLGLLVSLTNRGGLMFKAA